MTDARLGKSEADKNKGGTCHNYKEYVDSLVATISPFKVKSLGFWVNNDQRNHDDATAKKNGAIRKLITRTAPKSKSARLAITRNDSVKSQLSDADVLAPAERRWRTSAKVLQEGRATFKERKRHALRLSTPSSLPTKSLRSQKACDERETLVGLVFAELPKLIGNHAEIKLAFTKSSTVVDA